MLNKLRKTVQIKEMAIILFLFLITLCVRIPMLSAAADSLHRYDDAYYFSVARNLFVNRSFTVDVVQPWESVVELGRPYNGQPLLPIVLQFVFLHGHPYELAIAFNVFLTAILVCVSFLFFKKIVDLKIATLTSLLVALSPTLYFHSLRVLKEPLGYLLFFLSLVAIESISEKNKFKWIIVGFIVGLTNLAHEVGALLFFAIFIWMMWKKKYQGSFTFMFSYVLIILPWLMRNWLVLGWPFENTGIPISNIWRWNSEMSVLPDSSWSVMNFLYYSLGRLFLEQQVFVLLFAFAILGYISYVKKYKRETLSLFAVIIFLNFFSVIYFAYMMSSESMEPRFFNSMFLLLIPFAFFGLDKIAEKAQTRLGYREKGSSLKFIRMNGVKIIVFALVFAVVSNNLVASLSYRYTFTLRASQSVQKALEWIEQNTLSNSVIGSDISDQIYLRTFRPSVYMAFSSEHLSADLIRFYNAEYILFTGQLNFTTSIDLGGYTLKAIWQEGNVVIYKISKK